MTENVNQVSMTIISFRLLLNTIGLTNFSIEHLKWTMDENLYPVCHDLSLY